MILNIILKVIFALIAIVLVPYCISDLEIFKKRVK
jgi:hypothetical protein